MKIETFSAEETYALGKKLGSEANPGDVLTLKVTMERLRKTAGSGLAEAYVGDELACKCEIMFAFD